MAPGLAAIYGNIGIFIAIAIMFSTIQISIMILPWNQSLKVTVTTLMIGIVVVLANQFSPFEEVVIPNSVRYMTYGLTLLGTSFLTINFFRHLNNYSIGEKITLAVLTLFATLMLVASNVVSETLRNNLRQKAEGEFTFISEAEALSIEDLLTSQATSLACPGNQPDYRGPSCSG